MQTNSYLSQYCSHTKLQGGHSVDGHARRHARKICMSIYSINSTTIQKRNVMCVSALQTFQRERKRERKCWQNGLLAHTYHSQTFLAPPTCLCTVVTDGTLNELPLERWWGGGGDEKGISSVLLRWPRNLCNHSTAQTLSSFSSLHKSSWLAS